LISLAFCFFISSASAGSQQVESPVHDTPGKSKNILSETRLSDSDVTKKILDTTTDVIRTDSIDPVVSVVESKIESTTKNKVREGLGLFVDTLQFDLQIDSGDITTELQSMRAYDNEEESNFWFNQGGIVHENDRTTLNLGVGRRSITDNNLVMFGINAFYDHEFPDHHQRGSVGLEILSTPFQLTGNIYESISGYKSDLDGGNAKPASGHDYKVSTAMPYLPGITLSMRQFEWHGEDGARNSSGQKLGISGNLSQSFMIRYVSTEYDASAQSDNEELHLIYSWSQQQTENPTLFDVSQRLFEFRDIRNRKYQLVDRENRIVKQRDFSIIVEAI
jgi:hypothetical protein